MLQLMHSFSRSRDQCTAWLFGAHVAAMRQLVFSTRATPSLGEASRRKLDSFKARACVLARSGHFYGLPPLMFELSFEEGFHEAREWVDKLRRRRRSNASAKSRERTERPPNNRRQLMSGFYSSPIGFDDAFVGRLACRA